MAVGSIKLDKQVIVDALVQNAGNIRATSRHLDISHQAIYNLIENNPDIKEIIDKERRRYMERIADFEDNLVTLAYQGLEQRLLSADITAIIFTLKSKGNFDDKNLLQQLVKYRILQEPIEAKKISHDSD